MTIEDTAAAVADTTDTTTDTTATAANPDTAAAIVSDKVEGQGQAEADKVEGDKPDPLGAPETYESFTVPEGFALEGERLEFAQGLFRELNLSQTAAQKAVEAFCKADAENQATRTQFLESERAQRIEQWGQQTKTELGAKYDETLTLARAGVAFAKEQDPAIMEAFESEGWGNHPSLVRVFAKLGELTRGSGPKGLEGETTTTDRSSIPIEKRLYPNMA